MDDQNDRTLSRKFESLDYDLIENVVYLEHQHKSRFKNFLWREFQRWLAIFLIGLATAMSGFFAGSAVSYLTREKFSEIIQSSNDRCQRNNTTHEPPALSQQFQCMFIPYMIWLAWNIGPSLIGSAMVTYIAPVAAGSGIPVVKCYLNGVKIPEVVRFKTYVTKLLGVVASVVGGLAVGKEGPFIHCGAAIGAGLSQGMSTTLKYNTKLFRSFRNDRDKRDFVSAGASAGVAAAFGAPIGGVLFALEEGASFWNQALTWRIFFCSMMTSFILNLFMSAYNQQAGILAFYSLVNFGLVEELDYFWFEIPVYICIGIWGGIIGASFCYTNLVITRWRKRYLNENWKKVLEVILVAILTATAGVILILFASDCRKIPTPKSFAKNHHQNLPNFSSISTINYDNINHSSSIYMSTNRQRGLWSRHLNPNGSHPLTYDGDDEIKRALLGHTINFMCPTGEYSAMSSLWLKTSEGVASTFMVMQDGIWSIRTLAIFLIVYYILAVITYGLSISSGVFIPSLLIGATGGRLFGMILLYYLGPLEWLTQQNKFAIIGAASVLGGVVRMTISLTVIIIEATGCISFGLPIMICLMVSKWVADSFIEGLYDLAIHLGNIPFLDWEPPIKSYSIYASDAMSPDVKVLQTTETVANLINILQSTTHNGFPVVDLEDDYVLSLRQAGKRRSRTTGDMLDTPSTLGGDQSISYYTPRESVATPSRQQLSNLYLQQSDCTDTQTLVDEVSPIDGHRSNGSSLSTTNEDFLVGSFQRCGVTAKRESYGRFRGIILRWQILVMLDLKIFNENERSYEMLNLEAFQKTYPRYPSLEKVIAGLSSEMYKYHVDLRSIMNPNPYTVLYSASFPRIYQLFRSLGLRHLVVTDDRNQVVGMITRKDLARYVRERDRDGLSRFHELRYSS